MADVDPARAFMGPRDPLESPKKETALDPEKFKRVLKVEETDESQKRQKRRLKRSEEVEEEKKKAPSTDSPAEATVQFSQYMKEESQGISPFAEQAKAPMKRAEREGYHLVAEGERVPQATRPGLAGDFVSQEEEERFTANLPGAAPPQAQAPPKEPEVQESLSPQSPSREKESSPKPKEQTPEVGGVDPSQKPSTLPKKIPPAEVIEPSEKKGIKGKKVEAKPTPEPLPLQEKEQFMQTFSPKGKEERISEEKKKLLELEATPPEAPAEAMVQAALLKEQFSDSEKKEQSQEEGANVQLLEATSSALPPADIPLPQSPTNLPGYTNLSPQMFELFEKMVGLITIQEHQGVTQTKVTLNMSHSVFNGAQIILDHYSTAPNAFNITLAGSPEAVNYFNANVDDLIAAMQQTKFSFEMNVQRPILLPEYQTLKPLSEEKKSKEERKARKKRVQGSK